MVCLSLCVRVSLVVRSACEDNARLRVFVPDRRSANRSILVRRLVTTVRGRRAGPGRGGRRGAGIGGVRVRARIPTGPTSLMAHDAALAGLPVVRAGDRGVRVGAPAPLLPPIVQAARLRTPQQRQRHRDSGGFGDSECPGGRRSGRSLVRGALRGRGYRHGDRGRRERRRTARTRRDPGETRPRGGTAALTRRPAAGGGGHRQRVRGSQWWWTSMPR